MRSLRTQLLLSHLALVLLMGFVMGGAILAFAALGRSIDRVLEDNFQAVIASSRLRLALADQDSALSALVTGDSVEARRLYDSASMQAERALVQLEQSTDAEDETLLLSAALDRYASFRAEADPILASNELTLQPGTADVVRERLRPHLEAIERTTAQLQSKNEEEIRAANLIAIERADEYFIRSMAITVVALLLAIFLAMRMVRMALTPLAILAKHAEKIAQGELDQQVTVPRNDEIGALADSFNEMAKRLAEVRRSDVRRLQRAQLMSDVALESLYDPVLVTDAKGRIVHLNRAAEALFGDVPASPRRPLAEHIGDKRIIGAINRAIEEGAVSAGEEDASLVRIKVGNLEKTYRIRATPMKDQAEHLLGSVTVLEDITNLRELDRMKTEFIGVASHELRTPVTSLMLSTQLLLEGALGPIEPAQREVIEAQRSDLVRLEKLMRDLLDVTRFESGSAPTRLEPVSVEELLLSPLNGMKPLAQERGLHLEQQVEEGLPLVLADRSQIGRVLTNLIANAIRHTPAGGTIKVLVSGSPEGVTFTVEDTGEGIPREYLERIFERFVQVPGATQGGAGLGLSITSHIIRAHGGTMHVESELGHGSAFSFTLSKANAVEGKGIV